MSNPGSGASTPNPRFTTQTKTAEDLLAGQTVGLVNLSDFRKRRAEALDQKERDAHDRLANGGSSRGSATPDGDSTPRESPLKKKKRKVGPPKLSFGIDDEEHGESTDATTPLAGSASPRSDAISTKDSLPKKAKFAVNLSIGNAPKALTKSALLREAQTRETLRKKFLVIQEAVKGTDINIPFVFYDGTNIPGGVCKVKKGDYVWLFLDKSRKVGAELGVGEKGANARREWARVGVDDLMMVRGDIIIPHHYDFYFFIMNRNLDPNNRLLFDYSSEPPAATPHPKEPEAIDLDTYNPLSRPSTKTKAREPPADDTVLEGSSDDPTYTKVVDRRWYERNKHIFPASVWQDFDPEKDYQKEVKRDAGGNAFFFS
ncbi:XAP5, circadian clock regulator-domain-containing protein [Amylocarpus encephaloides]|uniref:XAP5, circadian clock regulator-domain-containing protein n=1 Tax=Amylocarpus encephaloides TaxID=45428 RepID=A0A9P7YGQ0_9HELO|nr:XAP5, circadian clock regulator-domain-containing protein [Amylocarpus encephaloides]